MNDVLRELHGLQTVIETKQSAFPEYAVAIEYHPRDSRSHVREHAIGSAAAFSKESNRLGTFIFTVGCKEAWWSGHIEGPETAELVCRVIGTQVSAEYLTKGQCTDFRDKIHNAFRDQAIMISVGPTGSARPCDLQSVTLIIDPDQSLLRLKLERLDDRQALARTASIVLSNTRYSSRPTSSNKDASEPDMESVGVPMMLERDTLLRKLEETQQALREERHKYRSLLAAPSAANARGGGRPVIGLRPRIAASASQRSLQLPSSSPSSGRESGYGIKSSNSKIGAGPEVPSSDDVMLTTTQTQEQASQRTTSLVNPTRVRRADPKENDGFLGDDD